MSGVFNLLLISLPKKSTTLINCLFFRRLVSLTFDELQLIKPLISNLETKYNKILSEYSTKYISFIRKLFLKKESLTIYPISYE